MHYSTCDEAVEDLKQFGIRFATEGAKIDEEMGKKLTISTAEGLRMMQEYQQQNPERGAKLL